MIHKLFLAIENSDIQKVKELIEQSYDVNHIWNNEVAGHYKCTSVKHINIPSIQVFNNGSVNELELSWTIMGTGFTPLDLAVVKGNPSVVKLLIDNGSDVNYQTRSECALNNGYFISKGSSPLHFAIISKKKVIIHFLIKKGANVTILDERNNHPFHLMIEHGYFDLLIDLINKGLKIDYADQKLFNLACANNFDIMIHDYLQNNVNVNGFDIDGLCPLHHAARKGHFNTVQLLINKGAEVNIRDSELQRTAIHFAANSGNLHIVSLLIDNGADVNARDNEGNTPLHVVEPEEVEEEEDIVFLIENGADVNARNNKGMTPLDTLSHRHCPLEIADLLIRNGTDVNTLSNEGKTTLHYVLINQLYNQKDLVKLLLHYGADVNIRDSNGKSSLDIAYDNLKSFKTNTIKEDKRIKKELLAMMKEYGDQPISESFQPQTTKQTYIKEQLDKILEVIHILKQE